MFAISCVSLAASIVNQELVGKGRPNQALCFHFDCRMSVFAKGKNYEESCGIHLAYFLPPDRSYVSVFSAVRGNCFAKIESIDPDAWKHEITHDSCWRDIHVVDNTYFDMAKKINDRLHADGLRGIAPVNMTSHASAALFGQLFHWKPAKMEKDPSDPNSYRRKIFFL